MKTIFLIMGFLILSAPTFGAGRAKDCRRGKISINLGEATDKEGYVRLFQILATSPLRESFVLELHPFDTNTGERIILRTTSLTLKDAYPNATPEYRDTVRVQLEESINLLNEIPGVKAVCGEVPSGSHARMGGGF